MPLGTAGTGYGCPQRPARKEPRKSRLYEAPEQLGFPFGSPTALLEHSGFEGAVAGAGSGGGGRTARGAAAGILRLSPVRRLDATPRNLAWFVMGSVRERRKEGPSE